MAGPGIHSTHSIHGSLPATRWEDAYLAGNGRHGALVFGDPYAETVIVTHHDLTLPNGSHALQAPDLADRVELVRDVLLTGRGNEAFDLFTDGRPTEWGESFHPAFALRMGCDLAEVARDYRRSTDFSTGVITVKWVDSRGNWQRDCFVSRA